MRKKIIGIFTLIIFLIPNMNINAETLRDYENKLKEYQNQYNNANNQAKNTQNQINLSNSEIASIKIEVENMTAEVEQMHIDTVKYQSEIKEKEIEIKEVLSYYQLSEGQNLYLEYAFGAETITDLVYRTALVNQLIGYNDKQVTDLNNMIEANKKREIEIEEKEKELAKREVELENKVNTLTKTKSKLNDTAVSAANQVQIYKDLVQSYKNAGCKPNDVIGVDCAKNNNVAGWYRPIDNGYVTSEFGGRWGSFHRALDVSNKNPYNTKIYPVANGKIVAKYEDYYGALTVVIEHQTADGKYYSSLYAHMSKYNPNIYVGLNVTKDTYIGYMGNTGYSTGPHLHFEIAPCRLFNSYDKNCNSWSNYVAYVEKIGMNGSFKGPRQFLYFPNTWVTFTGRS